MARKSGPELRSHGQRSISSMFSNSRITAGGSGNGRPVPLMEFLDRKSEKRTSPQGCVVDAGLTPAVRERLDAVRRKNRTRSNKQDEQGDGIGRLSVVNECSPSCHREWTPPSTHWSRPLENADSSYPELADSMQQEKLVTAHVGDAGCEPATHRFESPAMDFIDLTEDENSAEGRFDGGVYLQEESREIYRKRKRSAQGATETCPVCNGLFPREMLQAHVESELDALEMLETEPIPGAPGIFLVEDGSVGAWGDHGRFPESSVQVSSRSRQSVLVLGDEPKGRRQQANVRDKNKRPSSIFNHYADGGGWWDEGAVGVDAEAVGSASVWEGLGSMSFGGML